AADAAGERIVAAAPHQHATGHCRGEGIAPGPSNHVRNLKDAAGGGGAADVRADVDRHAGAPAGVIERVAPSATTDASCDTSGRRQLECIGSRSAGEVLDSGEREGPVDVAAVGPGHVPDVHHVGAGERVGTAAADHRLDIGNTGGL